MKADHTLDCMGLYCPMPIVNTTAEIKNLKVGEVLEILADDVGIKKDIPAWCKATGHQFLGMEEADGQIKVYVRKTHD
ncbi:MAG: sulfurtransferase TusA family protein [Chloroflexi bacterium]|nr:sulfurtransferase TusA family protein [Chloroflexota bacterium]